MRSGRRNGRPARAAPRGPARNAAILSAYTAATASIGFGLHSAARLLGAGLSWSNIHTLADAGIIRIERVHPQLTGNHAVIYRLMFP